MDNLTKHQAVVLDLIQKLSVIKVLNGYKTDFGITVDHWRTEIIPEENIELINVRDFDGPEEAEGVNYQSNEIDIRFDLIVAKGPDTWKYLTDGIADLKKFINENLQYFLDTYIDVKFTPAGSGVEGIDAVPFAVGEAYLKVTVKFKTNKWNEGEPEYTV